MIGQLREWQQQAQTIVLEFEYGGARLEWLNASVFRVFAPFKRDVFFSRAIDQLPHTDVVLKVSEEANKLIVESAELKVEVGDDLKLTVHDQYGTLLSEDYSGARRPFVRRGNSELAKEEGHAVIEEARRYSIEVVKSLKGDECFYGLGERPGHLNKRGCFYRNWNTDDPHPHVESYETLYKSIPFFITLTEQKAFGIFFDNTYESFFDFGKENTDYYYFAANDGNLDYYFMYGPSMASVVQHYTELTGRTPLPQKWTLGYQQCRWSYPSAERVRELALEFRERRIPCDVIYLDIDYMDGYRVFTWNSETFPDPHGLIAELREQGFKVVTIIDPGVKKDRGYAVYEEGLANGYFATDADGVTYVNRVWPGDSVYPDFTDAVVRTWWGNLHRSLLEVGVAGIWTDMNEPASFNGPLPDDVQFKNDGYPTDHREAHNVYGSLMARATFEGVKQWTGKRPFVITRACYAGTQKYSTIWTGDNQSFWEHLRMSLPMLSNLGLSGMSFVGTDVGGFSFDCSGELLSRWVQVGCFTPLFRNHSAANTRDQEPWAFDAKTEAINRRYIELRYRLLPYLYDQLWRAEQTGLPLIRPLVLEYQTDSATHQLNDQFMCGDSILVAPIVQQGQTVRTVYLPDGEWIDYWTGQRLAGKQYILKEAPLDTCPIYVKSGVIIPNDPPQQYVGERDQRELTLDVYPGTNGTEITYRHLQDDGESYDYQHGKMNIWTFHVQWQPSENVLQLGISLEHEGWSYLYETISWRIHGITLSDMTLSGGECVIDEAAGLVKVNVKQVADLPVQLIMNQKGAM